MITKFFGDQFKIAFSVTHTSGKAVEKSLATIKGSDDFEYKAECQVNDSGGVELLITKEMYKSPGMYDVVFENYFGNGESATHFVQFSIKRHSGYKVSKEITSDIDSEDALEGDNMVKINAGDKSTNFIISAKLIDDLAVAGILDEYKNPLLTWVRFIFTDDAPNANKQGIGQDEFQNLIKSMSYMPIKANFDSEFGLEGHSEARIIGVIKQGQQQGNKVITIGAIYHDEFSDIVDFFKQEMAEGGGVDFSWEIRYKDSEERDGVEWLKEVTTKAVTAVQHPAYEGRTPLVSISAQDLMQMIDEELKSREDTGVLK